MRVTMAVDITLLFRASVKTVKTRNKALGVAVGGGAEGSRDELFRRSPRPKGDFSSRAREVVSRLLWKRRARAGGPAAGTADPPQTRARWRRARTGARGLGVGPARGRRAVRKGACAEPSGRPLLPAVTADGSRDTSRGPPPPVAAPTAPFGLLRLPVFLLPDPPRVQNPLQPNPPSVGRTESLPIRG